MRSGTIFSTLRLRTTGATLAFVVAACSRSEHGATDSVLARDLELAGRDAPIFTPSDTALGQSAPAAGRPRPRTPTPPRTSAPQPRARAPRPATAATVPRPAPDAASETPSPSTEPAISPSTGSGPGSLAGTALALATGSRVCTSNSPGDKLVARVNTVNGPGVGRVTPGSAVVLEVAEIRVDPNNPEQSQIIFRVRAVDVDGVSYPGNGALVTASGLQKSATTSKSSDVKKTAAGAIAGAILGQVIGKDTRSTVIGAAAGAAAGGVAARVTKGYEGCLPAGSALDMTMS